MNPCRVAIFASGSGSNAAKIIEFFSDREDVEISLIVSNVSTAGVLDKAQIAGIPTAILDRKAIKDEARVLEIMSQYGIDFIVLAGFLLLIPGFLVRHFPHRMVNIHPALLPKYGGKGMYGMNVHRAVKEAREVESGMTIHFVNEQYDEGGIVFQAKVLIDPEDSAEEIAHKVLQLEHAYYAKIIDSCIQLSRMSSEEE